jgi:DNA-binding transcriptional LysR family regulator
VLPLKTAQQREMYQNETLLAIRAEASPVLKQCGRSPVSLIDASLSERIRLGSVGSAVKFPNGSVPLFSEAYWEEMRIFLAVAKSKSFSAAAGMIGVSTPTVSRKIKRLQDVVGAQLIVISSNGTVLTEKGQELADYLQELDILLSSIRNSLKSEKSKAEGVVKIAASEGISSAFISPNIAQFTSMFPRLKIIVQRPSDLERIENNDTDLLVSFNPHPSSKYVLSQKLGTVHLVPVMSRSYFERHGSLTAENVSGHHFIQSTLYDNHAPIWSPWNRLVASGKVIHGAQDSISYAMMVFAGLGIGLLGTYVLISNDIVPASPTVQIDVPVYLQAQASRLESRPVRIVHDMLCELLGPNNPWFSPSLILSPEPNKYDVGLRRLIGRPAPG